MDIAEKKSFMLTLLHEGILNVSFTKVDGSHRDMKCTLKKELLPESYIDSTENKKKESTETICVWDLDKEGWRSFRIDSVNGFSFES
jgi:hypothetical protein